jgi:hypothetical protein
LINITSALCIIVFVEERDKREMAKIEGSRQNVVLNKLINAIRNYNYFFAYLYKETTRGVAPDFDKRSKNIFYETDNLIEHLNRLEFLKDGYKLKHLPFEEVARLAKEGTLKPQFYSWVEIFLDTTKKYSEQMHLIKDNYLFFLNTTKLITAVEGVTKFLNYSLSFLQGWDNFEMIKITPDVIMDDSKWECIMYPKGVNLKFVYASLKTMDTIYYTKMMMYEIDEITKKDNFVIPSSFFTDTNTAPVLGFGFDIGNAPLSHRKPIIESAP